MAPNVQTKLEQLLRGELKYTSDNLGLNMLITRLQKKVAEDSDCMGECVHELEEFAGKYPTLVSADFDKIAAL